MISDFRVFLQKNNVVALAIGFIMGAAVGKVVTALVTDVIMPVIGMALPDGDWRKMVVPIGTAKLLAGDFLGTMLDFIIIAFVIFMITKMFMKPEPLSETKKCPACLEVVAAAARRCKYCTEAI